jgi:hypothetical protein
MTQLWRKILFVIRRKRFDRDLEDEIQLHLEMKAEAGGGTEAARYAAHRHFGNTLLLRETSREEWAWRAVETFARDLFFGWRAMWRTPAVTATAVRLRTLASNSSGTAATRFQAWRRPAAIRQRSSLTVKRNE